MWICNTEPLGTYRSEWQHYILLTVFHFVVTWIPVAWKHDLDRESWLKLRGNYISDCCFSNFLTIIRQLFAEGQPEVENENRPAEDGNQAAENENVAEPGGDNGGHNWWGIVKEIQMIVFGFITSLLPGFHHID